jgi:hypothetical protein
VRPPTPRLRGRARDLALALAIGGLTHVACASGITAAIVLALSGGGGGGGGSETTAEGAAVLVSPLTDRFVGALVIPNDVQVTGFETRQDGVLVPTDAQVAQGVQNLIAQALQQRGIFDPQAEYLQFFQTSAPLTVQNGDVIRVRFVQSQGGQPVAESRIGFGGSNEADLLDDPPLSNFQAHDNPFLAGVPALSRSGSLVAVLLVAAIALLVLRAPAGRAT